MRIKIQILIYFLISINVFSQRATTVFDTLNVVYEKCFVDTILDSLVYVKDKDIYMSSWKVYFDQNKNTLAYSSSTIDDTCTIINFWRNGNIKKRSIYIKDSTGYFIWYYEEIFCSNNQLIRKSFPNKFDKQKITNYYCNGNKMNEFEIEGSRISGNYNSWYETGKKKESFYYLNNLPENKWIYYKEDESISKVEIYKKGKLIKTIKD